MKIEVGQFVRSEEGEIFKVKQYDEQKNNPLWMTINSKLYMKGTIIKASFKLTDLLQVEDYANGCLVCEKDIKGKLRYLDSKDRILKYVDDLDIKTILTHEQFENNCYKIGD